MTFLVYFNKPNTPTKLVMINSTLRHELKIKVYFSLKRSFISWWNLFSFFVTHHTVFQRLYPFTFGIAVALVYNFTMKGLAVALVYIS